MTKGPYVWFSCTSLLSTPVKITSVELKVIDSVLLLSPWISRPVVRQASWRGTVTSCYLTWAGVWVPGSLHLVHSCPAFLCKAHASCKGSSQSSSEVELRCPPRGVGFKGTLIEVHMP